MPSAKLYRQLQTNMRHQSVRRRAVRASLVAVNAAIVAVIVLFVVNSSHTDTVASPVHSAAATSATANPLDQVSSADIALTVARMSTLPETTAITNQAQSQAAEVAMASSSDSVLSRPQVVATTLKSKADIQNYTSAAGDTVTSIAARFGVTSDSSRWSNSLSGDAVTAGTKLNIPPVNGIVYTVKPGDTPDSLAAQFRANRDKIVAYNDAEIGGLVSGQQIIIPDATQVTATATAKTVAAAAGIGGSGGGFAWGSSPIYGYNGYDYGYCTWYVATQISVPANWGNASTWAYYAGSSGWNVSTAPTVGAIAQTGRAAGGLGHVAIVDAVSPDGSQVQIRDMNGVAGFGRVGYSGWIPATEYQHFISH